MFIYADDATLKVGALTKDEIEMTTFLIFPT